jgi:FkbM family methyltransferase
MPPELPRTAISAEEGRGVTWKGRVQSLGHRVGVHVARWPARDDGARLQRQRLLKSLSVEVLLDVGANVGQYATEIRNGGYEGQIVSFEPLAEAFRELQAAARNDPRWAARHVGLGATPGEADINISGHSDSSSILPMTRRYLDMSPDLRYLGTEKVRIETLDSASAEFLEPSARVAVKIDVQGYEMEVLRGGAELLRRAVFVESELNLVELYHGQAKFDQLLDTFYDAGLRLASFEPGNLETQVGALVWGNGIFVRDVERESGAVP